MELTLQTSSILGNDFDGVFGDCFSVQTAHGSRYHTSVFVDCKDEFLIDADWIVFDSVLKFRIGALIRVVIIGGGHSHYCHTWEEKQ